MKITLGQAKKVLKTVDAGLSCGIGNPKPGEMCVEAAVCYALGLPHGDDPGCVDALLRKAGQHSKADRCEKDGTLEADYAAAASSAASADYAAASADYASASAAYYAADSAASVF